MLEFSSHQHQHSYLRVYVAQRSTKERREGGWGEGRREGRNRDLFTPSTPSPPPLTSHAAARSQVHVNGFSLYGKDNN